MMYLSKRRRCVICNMMTENWQRVNGSSWHCYDGCKSTTGIDRRKLDLNFHPQNLNEKICK